MNKTRVIVVDDSALVRQLLAEILEADPAIEVVASASDPYVARRKIKELNPDVITLDVEMPRMDGITFLGNLMRLRPMPVVMVSSLTEHGADVTLKALELGAVDFVAKPKVDLAHGLEEYAEELQEKVKMAATVKLRASGSQTAAASTERIAAIAAKSKGSIEFRTTDLLVAVGASTGGTEAIKELLRTMPPDAPGMVITQHIPAAFSGPFARRMDGISAMTVCEARDGQQIMPGHVYIAPGDKHLVVQRSGARYQCRLNTEPPVNRHRPSVDVLFRSIVESAGVNAIGVLLTGMGADGAQGLVEMRECGAFTIAQDESTSVVWGMPGEAVKRGGANTVLSLQEIAKTIVTQTRQREAPAMNSG